MHPDGYIEIRDRLKDVIISGGENISSVEVEGVLLRHPAVQEVAIVGFPHERWGEAPHAFVVLKQGARADERELLEFARANSRAGRRWIDRKAAGEAVSDRAITSQPGALQSAAQCDIRQRATQNCDRQNSEIYLERATACHLSAVGQWVCQDQPHRHNEYAWQLTLLRDRATKNFRRQIGTRDQ